MAIERLSREDRFMLWPDRRWPQVNGALLLLKADDPMPLESLRQAVASRLDAVARFRQVLCVPPRRLGGPLWIDAPDFDIAQHVLEFPVPMPGREAELLAAVEELWRRPLDRARPLWEMWLLTGLADGRVAVFVKLHHVIADGVAAVATMAAFLDTEPDGRRPPPTPWRPNPPPLDRELRADFARRRVSSFRKGLAPAAHPIRTMRALRAVWPAVREILADKPVPATSLNGLVTVGHNLAPLRFTLAQMKDIAHAHAATVNDVYLELITAGLRRLLSARGELRPGLVVRISVPISLRLAERAQARGNLISEMVVPLPVGESDPLTRLRTIAAETAHRKQLGRPSLAVFPMNRVIGPLLLKAISRQHVNVASTNVPGPAQPLYSVGAPIAEVFPLLPLIGNEPLAVGAMSYAGQFNVMAVADRKLVPDLDVFAEGMRADMASLSAHSAAA